MVKIEVYLINLDDSSDRLIAATQQLNKNNIKFTRVSAYDGRNVNPDTIESYDKRKSLNYMGRELTGGEIGCYFSHLTCAKKFLLSDADFALVLEDDFLINTENLQETLADMCDFLSNDVHHDWYLMNVGANKDKISTPITTLSGHTIKFAYYFPMTTTGIIWSRAGAKAFSENKNTIFCPVDNYFRYWLTDNAKGLTVQPPLVVASGVQSDIGSRKKRRHCGSKHHFFYGFIKQRRLWSDKIKALCNKYAKRKKPKASLQKSCCRTEKSIKIQDKK